MAGVALAAAFTVGQASAQIRFDKLTECAQIVSLWSRLDAHRPLSACRQPSTATERALSSKAFPLGGACFLDRSPASVLNGFSCASTSDPSVGDYTGLLCFRDTNFRDVASYEDEHDTRYSDATTDYLARSAECGAFDGDVAPVGSTMFSTPLKFIAKPEFGFGAPRGSARNGMVVHGYASLDPDIAGRGRAIEVVEMFVGSGVQFGLKAQGKLYGEWRVALDAMQEMDNQVNDYNRRANMPLWVDFLSIDITRDDPLDETRDEKIERIADWTGVITDELDLAGLSLLPDDELEEKTGMSYADFRSRMIGNMPYGQRALMDATAGEMHFLADDFLADCTDDGLLMALLTSFAEPALGASEYGSIGLIMFGIGDCSLSGARRDMRDLAKDATDQLTYYLEDN